MKLKLSCLLLSFVVTPLMANEVQITEDFLLEQIKKNPPSITEIETIILSVKEREGEFNDNFDMRLVGKTSYAKNMERPFNAMDTISSPIATNSLGVEKSFKTGVNLSVNAYTNQLSNTYMTDATTAGLQADLSIDLYKNIFGKTTRAEENALFEDRKKSELDEKIQRKAFTDSVRKVYWNLVANEESMKLTEKLLLSSEKQVKDARRRLKKSVAEGGEVARYEAQVADRRAKLTYLKYQREAALQSVKEYFPELAKQNLVVTVPNLDVVVKQVLACNMLIRSKADTPLAYTLYDEYIDHSRKSYNETQKVLDTHSDPDLAFVTSASVVGKDFSYGDAYNDFSENRKNNYSVGLNLTFPLGPSKRDTRDVKKLLAKKRQQAEEGRIIGRIDAYHAQFVKMIDLLQEAIVDQKETTAKLAIALRDTEKKYRQARVSIRDLIDDQDSLLVSEQNEVEAKLQIITTLIDYLSVFTETPCTLNRK